MKTRWLSDVPIRRKVAISHACAAIGILMVTITALFMYELHSSRSGLEHSIRSRARVIAANLQAAVVFDDAETALELLNGLRADSEIVGARVVTAPGRELARYRIEFPDEVAPLPEDPVAPGVVRFEGPYALTRETIRVKGREYGDVYLTASTRRIAERTYRYLGIAAVASALSLMLIGLLALLFHRVLAQPIQDLAGTARTVSQEGRYDLRAEGAGKDEIGALVHAFNEMLQTIETQNAELHTLNTELEERVAIRTRDLEEAKDLAESASRAKSAFLANMSHEIRTPMNGILGMLELLATTDLSARQARYAGTARRSGEALLSLLSDVLDLSKIESGRLDLERCAFGLDGLVSDVTQLFAQRSVEKGVALVVDIDPELPHRIVGDPIRLRQVLSNLVSNALKFTEEGHVLLEIAEESTRADERRLAFRVRDTGIGIEPGKLETIFDSFAQADESTTRRFGGSGLGLTICRELVELMGGELDVSSRPGEGSTFSFGVPLEAADDAAGGPEGQPWQDVLIAVHERSPLEARALENLLRRAGYRRVMIVSGPDDLEAGARQAPETPPRLLLVDVEMLGRWNDCGPEGVSTDAGHLSVILLTRGSESDDERRRGSLSGYAVVGKPLGPGTLETALATALGRVSHARHDAELLEESTGPLPIAGHVLLVDDSEVNVDVAVEILEGAGLEVSVARDGAEAVARMAEGLEPDVILMDLQMPVMDGYSATSEIRGLETGSRRVPIIALTADVATSERERCARSGMDDFLSKPFTRPALLRTVRRWVAEAREPLASRLSTKEFDARCLEELDAMQRPGRPSLAGKVIASYLAESPELVKRAAIAAREEQREDLLFCLHKLKSSSARVGGRQLSELAAALESRLRASRDADLDAGEIQELERLHARLAGALRGFVTESPAPAGV